MDWYYANERDEQIRVGETELKTLVSGGAVRPDTLIWTEGMGEWKPCRQVKPEWFSGEIAHAGTDADGAELAAIPSSSTAAPGTSPYAASPTLPRMVPAGPPTDGLALASMICGIAGLLFMFCYGAGLPISIAAVVCGHLCRRRLLSEGNTSSAGLAMAGLITGYIGIALVILVIGFFVVFIGIGAMASAASSGSLP